MLRPVIMIGCGGSGQKAVRYVRDAVQRRLRKAGWEGEIPKAWAFLGLDTLNVQEDRVEIPTLPAADFLSVSLGDDKYKVPNDRLLAQYPPRENPEYKHLIGWRPCPGEVQVPLESGAGQFRAVGRVPGLVALDEALRPRLKKAFEAARAGTKLPEASKKLGLPDVLGAEVPRPIVVVCASMAGGTGAGIALDVVDLVRRTDDAGGYPVLVLFTPDIFDFNMTRGMAANSLGMMSETLAAYWSRESFSPFKPLVDMVDTPGSGPHSIFLVSRNTLKGGDLGDTRSVYRAVGEALSTWVTQDSVQERVNNFISVNWTNHAKKNLGGYGFAEGEQYGAVSSFGASSVTVGRDHFMGWSRDLLARMVLESLTGGHMREEHAISLEGDPSGRTERELISKLAERYHSHIYQGNLNEEGKPLGLASAREEFTSDRLLIQEKERIKAELQRPFQEQQQCTGEQWKSLLEGQARACQRAIQARAEALDPTKWGPRVLNETCRATSEVAAATSLLVAAQAVRLVIDEARLEIDLIVRDANKISDDWKNTYATVMSALESQRGTLTRNSEPVASAFEKVAQSMAFWWKETRLTQVREVIESAVGEVLERAEASLREASSQVEHALRDELVKAWPNSVENIPAAYLPSVVEFTLESHETWSDQLDELCKEAVVTNGRSGQPIIPVDAARWLLVAGDGADVMPILTTFRQQSWSPGTAVSLTCKGGIDDIRERVTSWIELPGSRFARFVDEGIGAYLSRVDPKTQEVRDDHTERLEAFRTRLDEAMTQSQPLLDIDKGMYAVIYGDDLKPEKLCAPFPFPVGHPAREIAEQIVGEESFHESHADTASVLVSSFVANPLHPLMIKSFTGSVASKLGECNGVADRIQSGFWLWRRSRTLDAFLPMPPDVYESMIRGFATARLCGYITAHISRPIRISVLDPEDTTQTIVEFPHPLLSKVDGEDILGGLLESFVLCFADVVSEGLRALEPYKRLYQLGELQGVGGDHLRRVLTDGAPKDLIVDDPRSAGDDMGARASAAREYIDNNLARLDRLSRSKLVGTECRGSNGRAEAGIPTLEIADVSKRCYSEVLDLIKRIESSTDQGVV